MSTTRWIQGYYNITVPCLNDQSGTTWGQYNQNGYIPLNHILLGDDDQTVYFWENTMTKNSMIYRIMLALSTAMGEEPVETIPFSFKANTVSNRVALEYTLPYASDVQLTVYDISGKVVARLAHGMQQRGRHSLSWNPKSDGIYFARLNYERKSFTRKIVILQ